MIGPVRRGNMCGIFSLTRRRRKWKEERKGHKLKLVGSLKGKRMSIRSGEGGREHIKLGNLGWKVSHRKIFFLIYETIFKYFFLNISTISSTTKRKIQQNPIILPQHLQ